jgi:hypothetical protein
LASILDPVQKVCGNQAYNIAAKIFTIQSCNPEIHIKAPLSQQMHQIKSTATAYQ